MYDGLIPGGLDCSDLVVEGGSVSTILNPLVEVPKEIQMAALDKIKMRARPLVPTANNKDQCLSDYRYIVLGHNSHRCCFTCWKKSQNCRFNFPRDLCTECSITVTHDVLEPNLKDKEITLG